MAIFVHTFEELKAELTYIRPSVRMLIELTEVFGQQFMAVKNDRNMLDFSDLEHYMLQLLADFQKMNRADAGETDICCR